MPDKPPSKSKNRLSYVRKKITVPSFLRRSPSPALVLADNQLVPSSVEVADTNVNDGSETTTIASSQSSQWSSSTAVPAVTLSADPNTSLTSLSVPSSLPNVARQITEKPLSEKLKVILSGTRELLYVVEKSADAFPLLKSPIAAVNALIHIYENVSGNEEEMERQLASLHSLTGLLAKRVEDDVWPPSTTLSILSRKLDEQGNNLRKMVAESRLTKIAKNTVHSTELRSISLMIMDALQQFQVELGLRQEEVTRDILKESVLAQLEISKDAPYTSAAGENAERQRCTPGTRIVIIDQICTWAKSPHIQPAVFWLYGLAGTGKTTIACSICEELEREELLASSYFCSIQLDSRQSKLIIPTIARHLASRSRSFAAQLVSELQADSTLAGAKLSLQLEGLLTRPWSESASKRAGLKEQPLVVVIDALDECDRGVDFLGLLLDTVEKGHMHGIKFLVTGRADPQLLDEWRRKIVDGRQVALHEVPEDQVTKDIRLYLEATVEDISPDDAKALASQAGGLFIFASTLLKYISPSRPLTSRERQKRLRDILTFSPEAQDRSAAGMDTLYRRIVTQSLSSEELTDEEYRDRLRILHTIVCVAEPSAAHVIAELLNIDTEIVVSLVESLHSVLFTTGTEFQIRIFHASFYDFLITEKRACKFHCSLPIFHLTLTKCCLSILFARLKFNICELQSSFIPDDQLHPPLAELRREKIGQTLAYACRHWWDHMRRVEQNPWKQLGVLICQLLEQRILFWIETMSLLGVVRECKEVLDGLHSFLLASEDVGDVSPLIVGAIRVVSTFISMPLPRSTSHLYLSVLSLDKESSFSLGWRSSFRNLPQVVHQQTNGSQNCQQVWNAQSRVTGAAFSPDGRRIVSCSNGKILYVWDVGSGQVLYRLKGHVDGVYSVAFSPDGKCIASGSKDKTIRLWSVDSASQELCHLVGHIGAVRSAVFSPSGKQLVSGSDDGTVRIWDVQTGQEQCCMEEQEQGILSVAISPNGKQVVSSSDGGTIRIWDVETGQQMYHLEGHVDGVCSVAFSPNGRYIASGSRDKTACLWGVKSGKELCLLVGHVDEVRSVAFSPDSKYIASGSKDRTIRLWEVESGKELCRLAVHVGVVRSVAFSPDGRQLVSGSVDKTIRIWDVEFSWQLRHLEAHERSVESVIFSPNGKQVLSGSDDETICIWDVESGRKLCCLSGHADVVRSVAFSPNGKQVVSGSNDKTIRIWDVESRQTLRLLKGHVDVILSVTFSPNGKHIASSSRDQTAIIWDIDSGEELCCLNSHTGSVYTIAFSPNSEYLASGSGDKTICIWDVNSGQELHRLEGHLLDVTCVAFSPNSKYIASGSQDRRICIWDIESGQKLRFLKRNFKAVRSVAFSPNGKQIVSGSDDKNIRIWEVDSGREICCLKGHSGDVLSVAYSPSGTQIVSSSFDNSICVWDANFGSYYQDKSMSPTDFTSIIFSKSPNSPHPHSSDTLVLCSTGPSYHQTQDGWLVTSAALTGTGREEKIIWLPPALRPFFPELLRAINREGFNKIDLTNCVFGARWAECYIASSSAGVK